MDIIYRERLTTDKKRLLELFYDFCEMYKEMDAQKVCINSQELAQWCLRGMLKRVKKYDGKIFVATFNEKVVAFIGFFVKQAEGDELLYHRPNKFGIIDNLFVDADYRNKNIGDTLLKISEKYFKEKKCEFSKLQVFGTNERAYKFYEKNKYVVRNFDLIKKI